MMRGAVRGILDFGPWPEAPVLLACSGGADSTFLALAWQAAAEETVLPPTQVVVVDHGQRPSSTEEAAAAADLYRRLGFRVAIQKAACAAGSNEGALRSARYLALRAAAEERGAAVILTAHHAGDQAETLLLRILRGTGVAGLTGIPQRRQLAPGLALLRPLLGCDPQAMRTYLVDHGQAWIEDPSNQDPAVAARNRLRQRWPQLEELCADLASARPEQALARLQQDALAHEAMVDAFDDGTWPWAKLPSHVRRQLLRRRLQEIGATPSPARLADLEGALLKRGTAAVDEDHRLSLRQGLLVFGFRRGDRPEGSARSHGEVLE